mmetsp:Transcript_6939/g.9213  ORF Transcript_6939/g.9213 Transcript_6939/m.9213 type:complete len:440 (-) Transcript_6939:457-1776(-)
MIGLFVAIAIIIATTYYVMVVKPSSSGDKKPQQPEEQKPKQEEVETKKKTNTTIEKKKPAKAPRVHRPKPPSHPRFVRRFGGHSNNITDIALSPNGEWMATAGMDSQVRLSRVEKDHPHEFVQHRIEDHDRVTSLSWEADGRTVACGTNRSSEVRFYRVRMKKEAENSSTAKSSDFPYELVELVKRRFSTSSKLDHVSACIADHSCSSFHLVFTSGESAAQHGQKVTAAWDGKVGSASHDALASVKTGGSGDVRLSQDGKFFCGRGGGSMSEVKLFEVVRKKVKGEIDLHFDKISPKSVMTLFVNAKVVDVAFLYDNNSRVCDRAVVCTSDGAVQLWSLDVEYRLKEDPKLLCTTTVDKRIVAIDSSFRTDRFAIVTGDRSLHVFTASSCSASKPFINLDFTVDECHADGVGDVKICPEGKCVYTRAAAGKDVFAWRAT